MRHFHVAVYCALIVLIGAASCTSSKKDAYHYTKNYQPVDRQLYDTIVRLDSIFFDAYNTCSINLDKYGAFFSENIEFYHDQGGLMTSKQELVDATKRNICGKVTRELVSGSVEVYPIKDYGAVEMGLHRFHNNQEPSGKPSKPGRFMIVWKHENGVWLITRVVSLH